MIPYLPCANNLILETTEICGAQVNLQDPAGQIQQNQMFKEGTWSLVAFQMQEASSACV